jgi:hypothetical protein
MLKIVYLTKRKNHLLPQHWFCNKKTTRLTKTVETTLPLYERRQ